MSDAAAGRHGRSSPDACSVLWDDAQGSALGTAPAALFWVALEQGGPWGARAATQSHLDPDLGKTVDRLCQNAGGRFLLIRRPGTHADPGQGTGQKARTQRVYVAGGLAGRPWLLEADLADPTRLTRLAALSIETLTSGALGAIRDALPELALSPRPVLMICTNTRRDLCCSVRGRPVAIESASQRPGQVWECSHTGGHRFAPTGVLLPHGQTLGRLSGTS
ncbi:MAG TPA: sucrase ferredoxin, partial [Dermatophilaceae bacterium]